jgi:transcription elongation factor Elf1
MYKLICPNCNSDNIAYLDEDNSEDTFTCYNCQADFKKTDAGWKEA